MKKLLIPLAILLLVGVYFLCFHQSGNTALTTLVPVETGAEEVVKTTEKLCDAYIANDMKVFNRYAAVMDEESVESVLETFKQVEYPDFDKAKVKCVKADPNEIYVFVPMSEKRRFIVCYFRRSGKIKMGNCRVEQL